jgi:prepilin-type N-terminal cleavage/methylation domain-containing protein
MTIGQSADIPLPQRRHSVIRKPTAQGFTLIEIIVILAVISILVAIMTPTVLKYIEEAQLNRAEEDVKVINAALNDLIKDTGQYPGSLASQNFICGSGTIATAGATGWAASSAVCSSLTNHLVINDPDDDGTAGEATDDYRTSGRFRFRGPYAQSINEDPWGNAYEVNASTLVGGNTSPTWVISAGPDGTFDTSTTATTLSDDDIGIRIK